ncbi:FolC bifunctional protein [Desulfonatronospira thiodismutans ASO3-1]|uniref:Dihydrofolate synthase/folylpolyglutamate synthase n=1 Tax=Desulfonatronospira thiodismutans ASO3-1 TaxID=555779 RepID=D6SSU0_9BACT|nr:folylpolyglutamate synthase/dihydrofolate synthase family protein [Desulfonatronospira thiodismutans]EFI33756.1 FolC bifunctional protein [Desulfonatronospira thiodismutans ASO3-1]
MYKFNDFSVLQEYLDHLGLFRMELGLERMQKALQRVDFRPGEPYLVQIIGTNGKGSTASYLESLARMHGLKTGIFTSPHLVSVKERALVNGKKLPDKAWLKAANLLDGSCGDLELTYFEFLTLAAVLMFRDAGVDLGVMEAGLGGRYDATTTLEAGLQVYTCIDMDHTSILGETIEEIARDKAMAVRADSTVVLARQNYPQAAETVQSTASGVGSSLYRVQDFFVQKDAGTYFTGEPDFFVGTDVPGIHGDYQLQNAETALVAWRILSRRFDLKMDPQKCLQALQDTFLPGRMHVVSRDPLIILDGAHNPGAMDRVHSFLGGLAIRPGHIVFTCLSDKEIEPMLQMLRRFYPARVLVPDMGSGPRSMDRQELLSMMGDGAKPLDDLEGFLKGLAPGDDPVLVCGSLYLLGHVYRLFPEWMKKKGIALF